MRRTAAVSLRCLALILWGLVLALAWPVAALGWALTWIALPVAERARAEIRRRR